MLLQEKEFLENLYEKKNKKSMKQIIDKATRKQLTYLIYIIFYVLKGEIPVTSRYKKRFDKDKITTALALIETEGKVSKMLKKSKCDLVNFVVELKSILRGVLHGLFNP